MYIVTKDERDDAFDAKSKLCRLMGYEDELQNDEKMFNMSHSIIRFIDVKFDEKLCSTYCLDTDDF